MYNSKNKTRSSEQQYTYLIMRYRRSYPPLYYLLFNTRVTTAEVLIEVLMAYRGIDTAAAAIRVILITNIIIATILMRNIREVLMKDI